MNKYVYPALLLVVAACAFLAGSRYFYRQPGDDPAFDKRQVLYYVDPMNPAHTSKEPGVAPCGMAMEAVYSDAKKAGQKPAATSSMSPGSVIIGPEKQQTIGVKTATTEQAPWKGSLRVLGRVAADETRIFRINAVTDGWIKKRLPVTTGDLVKKDELLATFYAPEFFSAMKAYLFGLRAYERFEKSETENKVQLDATDGQIENYRNALRNLGMTEHQLDAIRQTRQGGEHVEIRAPEAGFVQIRNVTEGERFQRGTELCRITDLNHVWILADIFEDEALYFRPGARVKITHPTLHKTYQGQVSNVLPQFDLATRTLRIRIEAENPGYTLRPDMFVDVDYPVVMKPALAVPSEAVIDTGKSKIVYVATGEERFEPREVATGWRLNDRVEITAGLQPGEKIVVSGNFLIDSESRMQLATAKLLEENIQRPADVPHPAPLPAVTVAPEPLPQAPSLPTMTSAPEPTPQAPSLPAVTSAPEPTPPAEKSEPTEAAGHTVIDPVCGMSIDQDKAREAGMMVETEGQTYAFCSDDCKEHFQRDPQHYPGKVAQKDGPDHREQHHD